METVVQFRHAHDIYIKGLKTFLNTLKKLTKYFFFLKLDILYKKFELYITMVLYIWIITKSMSLSQRVVDLRKFEVGFPQEYKNTLFIRGTS